MAAMPSENTIGSEMITSTMKVASVAPRTIVHSTIAGRSWGPVSRGWIAAARPKIAIRTPPATAETYSQNRLIDSPGEQPPANAAARP